MKYGQNKTLDADEEKILKYLFLSGKSWLRNITDKHPGFNTTTAKRALTKLGKKGYVANDRTLNWTRGQKINYYLTPDGRRVASQLIVGDAGKELFIKILGKVLQLAKLWDGNGEKEAETAIDIVNLIDSQEAGENIERIVIDLLNSLKEK